MVLSTADFIDQLNKFLKELDEDLNVLLKKTISLKEHKYEYDGLILEEPKISWQRALSSECDNYAGRLFLKVKNKDTESPILLSYIPFLTPRGTFVIHGRERIVLTILTTDKKHQSEAMETRDLCLYRVEQTDIIKDFKRYFGWLIKSIKKGKDIDNFLNVLDERFKGDVDKLFENLGSVEVSESFKKKLNNIKNVDRMKFVKKQRIKRDMKKNIENFLEDPSLFTGGAGALIRSIFNSQSGISRYPFLDSTNPLSEVSNIRKISFPGSKYSKKGRDIHPSHYGRLCVVETPESDKIGLRLHLAHKAKIEPVSGKIVTPVINLKSSNEIKEVLPDNNLLIADKQAKLNGKVLIRGGEDGIEVDSTQIRYKDAYIDQLFGYAALQVPFIQHNDPARALMGAKNLKQAVPLKDPEIPIILTGYEKEVAELSGRIIKTEIDGEVIEVTDDKIIIRNNSGEEKVYDLIHDVPSFSSKVAFYQKPIVKERESVKEGQIIAEGAGIKDGHLALGANFLVAYMPYFGFNMDDGIVVSQRVAEKLVSIHIEEHNIKLKDGDTVEWLAPEGLNLQKGTPVAIIKHRNDKEEIQAKENMIGGTVRRSFLDMESNCIRLWIKKEKPLEVGDKLMGRHGNKGVVAKILPTNTMPYFEINKNGRKERKYIDIILNPHSVISRMNIGQIFETHLGWVAKEHPDKNIREKASKSGRPFNKIKLDELSKWLEESGLNSKGKITLKVNEKDTLEPVVVGYQYIVKLNHLASDKLSIRGERGPISFVTEMPLSGKKRGGGQRIGEMEVWALIAHGAWDIVKDFLGRQSNAHVLDSGGTSISESLKVLVYYLRGLGISLEFLNSQGKIIHPEEFEKKGVSNIEKYRIRWADESDMIHWGTYMYVPKKNKMEKLKDHFEEKKIFEIRNGAKKIVDLSELQPEYKEEMCYIQLKAPVKLCGRDVSILPVIPVRCRPKQEAKINKLYKKIFLTNLRIEKNNDEYHERINTLVDELEKEIRHRINGKRGIIRKAILGKRINFSSRAVIVPDPFICADEVKVPKKIMEELDLKVGDVVLLNRQPSLHIHNIQGFKVIKSKGNIIAINPLVCGGFNADFDGDTIALYKYKREEKDVPKNMMASEQIILSSNGGLNLNLSQDIVSGLFIATSNDKGREELENIINDVEIYSKSESDGQIDKNRLKDIVYRYFLKMEELDKDNSRIATLRLSEKIAELGIKWSTYSGLTFSLFDLDDVKLNSSEKGFSDDKIKEIIEDKLKTKCNSITTMILSGARGDFRQINQMVGVKGLVDKMGGRKTSIKINSCYLEGLSPTEYYLACFGARNSLGDKKLLTPECGYLTRKLVFAAADMDISEEDCNTTEGILLETTKILGRTTAEEVIHNGTKILDRNIFIDEKALNSLNNIGVKAVKVRSPLTCEAKKGICCKCYGWDLSRRCKPPLKFKAGIISAGVIGERATQDAMRTYHVGTATGTISLFDKVKSIFDNSPDPETNQKVSYKVKTIEDLKNLANSLYEYYEKKVDIKHYELILRALTEKGVFKGTKDVIEGKSALYRASFERALKIFKDFASKQGNYKIMNIFEKLFI